MGKHEVLRRQKVWANGAGIAAAGDYCQSPNDNLPWLTARLRTEVEEGDGNEFGGAGAAGKICALHSSSALGLNVFGYWQGRDCTPLANALGLSQVIKDVQFERKFKTGVASRVPNLDVVLTLEDGSILAIESKFTEWFGVAGKKPLRAAYFPKDMKRWASVGLTGAQTAAERYAEPPGFLRLDVPQLIKHMLGLASQRRPWQLALVWYEEAGKEADQMRNEIGRFKTLLGPDAAKFSAMTYQEFWGRMKPLLGIEHQGYERYLEGRYFKVERT